MAKLISVVRRDDHKYYSRQMPLVVEDKLTIVLQFPDFCKHCGIPSSLHTELKTFSEKYLSLDIDERIYATSTTQDEVAHQLSLLVPCVGCRKSVGRLLDHVALTGNGTIDPISVYIKDGQYQITLKKSYVEDPKLLFGLLYIHGTNLNDFLSTLPRSKKNKRCQLHSLDTQKAKTTSNWSELWSLMSRECQEEVLTIDYQKFMEAVIVYLDKHRFCVECKTKVLHAHGLLIGDECKKRDKSFCPMLYDGVDYCKTAKHIHIRNDKEFIANLIARAEPDLLGSRRDRHAKTMDIAQEEVLSCLGSYLYVRLNCLLQKVKLEEQTWKQLFYISICCLRRNFEVMLEKKRGISQLELLCSELELEERTKELKKENKRRKKKSKREKKILKDSIVAKCNGCETNDEITECAQCYKESQNALEASSCDDASSTADVCSCDTESTASQSPLHSIHQIPYCSVRNSTSDHGYSSGPDNCSSCSTSSSVSQDGLKSIIHSYCDKEPGSTSVNNSLSCSSSSCYSHVSHRPPSCNRIFHSTLEGMLATCDCRDDQDDIEFISEEDIAALRASMPSINQERIELRRRLKEQFDKFHQTYCRSRCVEVEMQ